MIRRAISLLFVLSVLACKAAPAQGPAQRSPQPDAKENVIKVETVARGLVHPWGLELLPDGRMLVTERPGRLRIVARDGTLSGPLAGVPQVAARGQGGLLDVALDPAFATNSTIYLSFSEPGDGNTAGTSVARARLGSNRLEDVRVIYRQAPKVSSSSHFGSRIVFRSDGTMLITGTRHFRH